MKRNNDMMMHAIRQRPAKRAATGQRIERPDGLLEHLLPHRRAARIVGVVPPVRINDRT